MQLILPTEVTKKMRSHLVGAKRREIGGMIMGEEVGDQRFRVLDFSVDAESGTAGNFMRDGDQHDQALDEFFKKTGSDYRRFNYLGEWHSHPSFSVHPSLQDVHAMQDLVDGTGGVDFAALLITRLNWCWRFECSAHLFVRHYAPTKAKVVYANRPTPTTERT